jgi:hypothetical protein
MAGTETAAFQGGSMRLITIATLAGMPCLLGTSMIHAAPVTVLRQHTSYEVGADGTWTMDVDTARRIDEAQAVASNAQAPLPYSESLQSLEILEAYTTTRDGMRIDVPADKIITQQQPASAGAPTFGDNKVRVVVFPQVEVGATLSMRFRIRQLKPFLPGLFSATVSFNQFMDMQNASMTVRAPESMQLHVSSRGVQGGEVKSSAAGFREWRWTHADSKAILPEPGSMMPETFFPYAAVSTFQGYTELAKAYMLGAEPAAKVTPAVQKLADEITAGITDRRAQAEALYRWVSTRIRYVAIFMGTGGYVPHDVDDIIAARYGDCKDKTTLLTALLHSKGIRAMPALIHTAETYKLPDTVLLGAFNHAIVYLPEWDLFVDSTSGFAPFGVLASNLRNKQALLVGDQSLQPVVRTTPALDAARDHMVVRTKASVSADGTVTGTNSIQALGSGEPTLRGTLGVIPEAARPAMAQRMLSASGQTGEARLLISDGRDLATPFSFVFEFKTPQRVNVPGPGALSTSFGMPIPSGAQSFAASVLQIERKLDFPCPREGSEEQLELALPSEVKISTLPPGANIESPFGRFNSSYEVKDQKLLVMRRLNLTPPRAVCTAADTAELRRFATAISQTLRAQILYQ